MRERACDAGTLLFCYPLSPSAPLTAGLLSLSTHARVEEKKLLSFVEKAGLLSAAEKAGLSLQKVEQLKLLSTAESLGLLSLAESAATTDGAVIASLGIPFFALGCGTSMPQSPMYPTSSPLSCYVMAHIPCSPSIHAKCRRPAVHSRSEPVSDSHPERVGSHPLRRRFRPAARWQPGERPERVNGQRIVATCLGIRELS